MYSILSFACTFTSAFHSSEQNHSNLYTCAPYVLGSSLRGAVLRALIYEHCEFMDRLNEKDLDYHDTCSKVDCPVKLLLRPPTRFSFGFFEQEKASTGLRTRVGIGRESNSVAEGALLSIEVRYGNFFFSVLLPDDEPLKTRVEKAVKEAGEWGVGRFRSTGWGRFTARPCPAAPVLVDQAGYEGIESKLKYRFSFRTPYVLAQEVQAGNIPREFLEKQLHKALEHTPAERDFFLQGDARIWISSLYYIRRWSDERHQKENRLVAGPGTKLEVTFRKPVTQKQLELWQWGIGHWWELGFGSFQATPL